MLLLRNRLLRRSKYCQDNLRKIPSIISENITFLVVKYSLTHKPIFTMRTSKNVNVKTYNFAKLWVYSSWFWKVSREKRWFSLGRDRLSIALIILTNSSANNKWWCATFQIIFPLEGKKKINLFIPKIVATFCQNIESWNF